jgi:hypothetical protein
VDVVAPNSTVKRSFNTIRFTTAAPHLLAGTPSMHARVDGNATELTTGLSLSADFDSKTGENQWTLDLSASASYTAGSVVEIFIAAGTVDSVSVVALKVYEFRIGTSGSLDALITRGLLALPAAASGSGSGLATSTNVSAVETDTQDIQGRLPATLSGGRMRSDMEAISSDSTAADNLESYADGTTPLPVNVTAVDGQSLETHTAGYFPSDLRRWKGTAPADLTDTDKVSASVQHKSSSVGLSTQEKADAQTEAEEAIDAKDLDHLLNAAYDPANKPGHASSLFNAMIENDAGVPQWTGNSLEEGPSGGGGSANIVVQPYSHNTPQRVLGMEMTLFLGEFGFTMEPITAYDTQSPPETIDLSSMDLVLTIANNAGTVLATPAVADVDFATGQWTFIVPATITGALYEKTDRLWWSLNDYEAGVRSETIGRGRIQVLRRDVAA